MVFSVNNNELLTPYIDIITITGIKFFIGILLNHIVIDNSKLLAIYHIAQNFGGVKLWRIDCFRVLVRENVGKFTIAISDSGIWLGKILANGIPFAKSAEVFHHQNFALYGNSGKLVKL